MTLTGSMSAHGLAIVSIENLAHALLGMVAFGVVGILLVVFGFKLFDWLLPKVDVERELAEKGNVAVAIVMAAVVLGVSAVIVASIL
jgi:putative membrane protein